MITQNVSIDVKEGDVKISHGVVKRVIFEENVSVYENYYRNSRKEISLPLKFKGYLLSKILDRVEKGLDSNELLVEFTLGKDEESGICAIAIVHERDSFNRKIGRAIVEGRIKRMKGEIFGREPYSPIPKFIEVRHHD